MGRIDSCFERLKKVGRKGLITYITAGDPDIDSTLEYMNILVDSGADIIEIGVPFSDPIADGPTIQRASERALNNGIDLNSIFELVGKFRDKNSETPIVLMGYLNPFEQKGFEKVSIEAQNAGVDGFLIVDLPPEEASQINGYLSQANLSQIFLVAPNSSLSRVNVIKKLASGFIYFVSVKGVTGDKGIQMKEISENIEAAKEAVNIPIGIGFGIKKNEDAQQAAVSADAVIVGSALIEIIEKSNDKSSCLSSLASFVLGLRKSIDGVVK